MVGSFGAEVGAKIGENCFEYLDAPIKRVGSKDIPISYSQDLENYTLVQNNWIEEALLELINY